MCLASEKPCGIPACLDSLPALAAQPVQSESVGETREGGRGLGAPHSAAPAERGLACTPGVCQRAAGLFSPPEVFLYEAPRAMGGMSRYKSCGGIAPTRRDSVFSALNMHVLNSKMCAVYV